jgi:hypothetical protein
VLSRVEFISQARSFRGLKLRLCFAALGLLLFIPMSAFASLGGDVNSIMMDQIHFQGNIRTTQSETFTMHEIHSANGTVIHEYVSPAGKVFAVTWHSAWPPDLHQLLGTYFDEYHEAARTNAPPQPGRRVVRLREPDFVFEQGGHPRSFVGRAYLPQMLPPGVTVEALQ